MGSSFQDQLEKRATRSLLTRAVYRWESAVIIALTVVLFVLLPQPFPFWERWFWLVLGLLGEIGLVWTSLTDPEFRARAVGEIFREKFRPGTIRTAELKKQVDRGLEYRDRIDQTINKSRDGALRDHLKDVSRGVNIWSENLFRLAARIDAYRRDQVIQTDMKSVEPDITRLKQRLSLEDDDTVKRQISQAIAQKQIQRENLLKLQNVMEQAEFQLDSTLTAMGTVYSQVVLLNARDVGSGRAQRLQQDVNDQVQALQDVVTTVDEVYHAGDALGPAAGTAGAPAAAAAAQAARGQSGRKGAAGP